ncbi:MAG TPA: SRPBCC family protein [Acidimicrobiales bacterium]|nr:SRPBCC family protein [Acidimicrobiales bacterium]
MAHLVRAEADTPAPIESVWHLLSAVETWPTWSRHKLARLERDGRPTPDGVGAIRVLGVNPAKPAKCNREEVVTFDAPTHFGYKLLSGQPLDDYHSEVTLLPRPGGGTHITWESRFATHGPTGWFWVLVVRWVLRQWSADLANGAVKIGVAP